MIKNRINIDLNVVAQNIEEDIYVYIGSGSGRRVYDLGNGYVVKYAKNRKGYAQNEVEYKIASIDTSDIFAKVAAISENQKYLIMEKGNRILDYHEIMNYFHIRRKNEIFKIEQVQNAIKKYNLVPNDVLKANSWGIINNRPVLIDYGFTWGVRKKYY